MLTLTGEQHKGGGHLVLLDLVLARHHHHLTHQRLIHNTAHATPSVTGTLLEPYGPGLGPGHVYMNCSSLLAPRIIVCLGPRSAAGVCILGSGEVPARCR